MADRIQRKSTPLPVKWMLDHECLTADNYLYLGRGNDLKTVDVLKTMKKSVFEYDPNIPKISNRKVLNKKYETVLSIYVLNTLPPNIRKLAIQDISNTVEKNGIALIVVRGRSGNSGYEKTKQRWSKSYDGFSNGKAFQKYYTTSSLYNELEKRFSSVQILCGSNKSLFLIAQVSNNAIALPIKSKKYGVGKDMIDSIYIHKKYADCLPNIKYYKQFLPENSDYQIVKYNRKNEAYSFIQCKDFDTSHEPAVGDSILIKKGQLKILKRIKILGFIIINGQW